MREEKIAIKRTRTFAAVKKSENERDNTMKKYFKTNNLLCSKDSTGDVLEPVQTAGHSGHQVNLSKGEGEAFQPIVHPDAPAKLVTEQLMG